MRKAVVKWSRARKAWGVYTTQGGLTVPTHAEAMFLAQLLADPHEYVRAAQSKAWRSGIEDAQEGFYDPDPYRKDKTNE